VLGWLLGHADEAYYLRELVRHTGGAVGAVQRELEQLTAAGLVRRDVRGRQVYFQANREAAIFPELQGLFAKTAGLVDIVREALTPLAGRLRGVFIFGSAARGELRASSDIDLLVVGEASFGDVGMAVREAEKRLGRDVNPTVYSLDEFRVKVLAKQHFLTTVLAEPKIFVFGGESDLGELVTNRTAAGTADQPKRHPQSTGPRAVRRRQQRG
jgi:predicted nucleotidyltransferase